MSDPEIIKILIIEDDEDDILLIRKQLEKIPTARFSFRLGSEGSLKEGLERLAKDPFDVVLLDLTLHDSRGIATLSKIRENFSKIPIVVFTGFEDEELALESLREGAQDYLFKGSVTSEIVGRAIRYAIERKKTEDALLENEKKYRFLYESNPTMYFTVDPEGTVLSVNAFGAQVLGYKVSELLGQPVLNIFFEEDKEAVQKKVVETLENPNRVFSWEFRKVRKDGSVLWVRESAQAVEESPGNKVVLIVCEDITGRKRLDRIKNEFIDTIYHEIKSPLDAIYETTNDLKNEKLGGLEEKQKKVLEIIGRNINRLTRITGELHDLSRLELGRATLHPQKIQIIPLIKVLIQQFESEMQDWNTQIVLDIPQNFPAIFSDAEMLKTVFYTLINNALRASRERITILGEVMHSKKQILERFKENSYLTFPKESDEFLLVSIMDDGPGHGVSEMVRYLHLLEGVIDEGDKSGGGKRSRLDLAICKEIMELHQGCLWVGGGQGEGGKFHCIFPLK